VAATSISLAEHGLLLTQEVVILLSVHALSQCLVRSCLRLRRSLFCGVLPEIEVRIFLLGSWSVEGLGGTCIVLHLSYSMY
jgi:hypothetical protein